MTEDYEHERLTLRLADGLEFEVDKGIAPLIEACWKSGVFIIQSGESNKAGNAYLQFASTVFADQFLANIFADGDIYLNGNKIVPADWKWSLYQLSFEDRINFEDKIDKGEFDEVELGGEKYSGPSVIVRFPVKLIELLTERLLPKESLRPEPDGMIWKLLPEPSADSSE